MARGSKCSLRSTPSVPRTRRDESVRDRIDEVAAELAERWLGRGFEPIALPIFREQDQALSIGVREAFSDLGLLVHNDLGGGLGDGKSPIGAVVLRVRVDQDGLPGRVSGQAVHRQLANFGWAASGFDEQLDHSACIGAAAYRDDIEVVVDDPQHPPGYSAASLLQDWFGRNILVSQVKVVRKPSRRSITRVRPRHGCREGNASGYGTGSAESLR